MKTLFVVLLLTLKVFGEEGAQHPLHSRLQGRLAGAHQGGFLGPHAPNSLPQFESAREMGVDIIEMDLRVTRDGVVVVFHDERLMFATNCDGRVSNKLYSELIKCKFHNTKYGISTFDEVLDWAAGRVVINAEFKDVAAIEPSLQSVAKRDAYSWVYFQTQNTKDKYQLARQLDPQVALLFRVDTDQDLDWVESLQDDALVIVEIEKNMRRPEVIDRIHGMGKKVSEDSFNYHWTRELFNANCKKVFANNIDIAISNRTRSCRKQK